MTQSPGPASMPPQGPKVAPARSVRQPASLADAPGLVHSLAKALVEHGVHSDRVHEVLKHTQHVEYGLSAEDEFAAIAAWLGRVRVVHKLDQPCYSSKGELRELRVPDLFVVAEHRGAVQTAVIEVKTTEWFDLPLDEEYVTSLKRYSELVGHRLLIAWRPRVLGSWFLFDPDAIGPAAPAGGVSLQQVAPASLMGGFLGDFLIVPKKGSGMCFRLVPRGPRENETEHGYTQLMQLAAVDWLDGNGQKVALPSPGALSAVLATAEEVDDVADGEVTHAFLASGREVFAQQVLRFNVGWACGPDERVRWRNVLRELNGIISRDQLLADATAAIGSSIHLIGNPLLPKDWPSWLSKEFRQR